MIVKLNINCGSISDLKRILHEFLIQVDKSAEKQYLDIVSDCFEPEDADSLCNEMFEGSIDVRIKHEE